MKIKILLLSLVVILTLASCKQFDVVGNKSVSSFKEVLNTIPKNIKDIDIGWSLNAPDGTARFLWSKDFSKSQPYDVMLEFDAKPFIDAGLNASKLTNVLLNDNKLVVGTKLGYESITYNGKATALASYEKIVELNRKSIKYHSVLDHYGIDLADGNVFEWAKDMSKNDKDIVFVLNPKVFIDAGVDPAKVKGWVFAKVEVMDKNNKKIKVDKFLKTFNLK